MNVFGERQHPEKFIPSTIKKIRDGQEVIIHANQNLSRAGSRYYIHARNVCDAVNFLLNNGVNGEKYNIVGEREIDNLSLATMIANIMNKPLIHKMVDFHSSRPGHDLRYALDGSKLQAMGWQMEKNLEKSLETVITWSLENESWLMI